MNLAREIGEARQIAMGRVPSLQRAPGVVGWRGAFERHILGLSWSGKPLNARVAAYISWPGSRAVLRAHGSCALGQHGINRFRGDYPPTKNLDGLQLPRGDQPVCRGLRPPASLRRLSNGEATPLFFGLR